MSRKEYIDTYLTMISLRGLTDHTLKSYKTYISAYLDFVFDLLHPDHLQMNALVRKRHEINGTFSFDHVWDIFI